MFSGNWFATTYFPDPYFFGAGVDSDDLYDQWVKEGQAAFFMYHSVVYMVVTNPDMKFIEVRRGANPERADRHHRWDGLYGPYGRQWRKL